MVMKKGKRVFFRVEYEGDRVPSVGMIREALRMGQIDEFGMFKVRRLKR